MSRNSTRGGLAQSSPIVRRSRRACAHSPSVRGALISRVLAGLQAFGAVSGQSGREHGQSGSIWVLGLSALQKGGPERAGRLARRVL